MNKQLEPVPAFASETKEGAFWESHDSDGYVDWYDAQPAVFPNLRMAKATAAEAATPETAVD